MNYAFISSARLLRGFESCVDFFLERIDGLSADEQLAIDDERRRTADADGACGCDVFLDGFGVFILIQSLFESGGIQANFCRIFLEVFDAKRRLIGKHLGVHFPEFAVFVSEERSFGCFLSFIMESERHLFEDDLNFAIVISEELVDGRFDTAAERALEFRELNDRDGSIGSTARRRTDDIDDERGRSGLGIIFDDFFIEIVALETCIFRIFREREFFVDSGLESGFGLSTAQERTINEEVRCATDACFFAFFHRIFDGLLDGIAIEIGDEFGFIESEFFCIADEIIAAHCLLIVEDLVIHFPEFALDLGSFCGLVSEFCILVERERIVFEDDANRFGILFHDRMQRRVTTATERAFEVGEFDGKDLYGSVKFTLHKPSYNLDEEIEVFEDFYEMRAKKIADAAARKEDKEKGE